VSCRRAVPGITRGGQFLSGWFTGCAGPLEVTYRLNGCVSFSEVA
jgi:hypothetical protein